MPKTSEHPVQKYLQLREQNLAFFQRHYPGIYQFIANYQMQSAKLDILPELDEVDILIQDQHLYKSQSKTYAKHEVATFLSSYDYGSKIHSFRPLERDAYKNQRFFARAMSELHGHYYDKADEFDGYTLDDFLPLMVFMGIGLGKHIEILTQIRDISHAVALETDMDRFAASLYSVDWQGIVEPFLNDPSKSFQFILLPGPQNEEHIHAALWNTLIGYCPVFPVTTLFYNHLANPVFDKVSDRVNADIYIHLFSFGNVDDELNQLNNALHNFKQSIPFLNINNIKQGIPICIVGSGPSLDARIEDLKAISKDTIIISSGTALRALWKHGIRPDFQVELESDFNSYITQGMMEDKDFMRSIKLLGAAQLNPLMFNLFEEARIFFKDDGALSNWFGNKQSTLENATPTCTNAAMAAAFKLQAPRIFLFGLDYGFPDNEAHHASGSVYYKGSLKDSYKVRSDDTIEIPSASGGQILTTTFLYTAKRRIENMLVHSGHSKIFNCSNGAHLDNTRWLEQGQASQYLSNKLRSENDSKAEFIKQLFNSDDRFLAKVEIENQSQHLANEIHGVISEFSKLIDASELKSVRQYCDMCSRLFPFIQNLEKTNKSMFYFIRGSIWHFLLAGYTHVFSLKKCHTEDYLAKWRNGLVDMLSMLEQRFNAISQNSASIEKDPMVNRRLCEAVMDELIWEYQGFSIREGEIYLDESEASYAGYYFDGKKYVPEEKPSE